MERQKVRGVGVGEGWRGGEVKGEGVRVRVER